MHLDRSGCSSGARVIFLDLNKVAAARFVPDYGRIEKTRVSKV